MAKADASERKNPPNIHEIKPSSGWTDDSDCHCLLIDLPGFEKEHVVLQADHNSGLVTVTAERKDGENNYISFKQSYKVPDNAKVEEADAKFEDGILYVIVPKEMRTPNDDYESYSYTSSSSYDDESYESSTEDKEEEVESDNRNTGIENQSNRGDVLEEVMKKLKKNRIVLAMTAALAITLGVFVARK